MSDTTTAKQTQTSSAQDQSCESGGECDSCTGSCRTVRVTVESNKSDRKSELLEVVREQRNALSDRLAKVRVDLQRCQDRRDYFRTMAHGFHKIIEAQADTIFRLRQEVAGLNEAAAAASAATGAVSQTQEEAVGKPVSKSKKSKKK